MNKTIILVITIVLQLIVGGNISAQQELDQEPRPANWLQDAQLNDVCFLNPRTGWAVGEQGVILKTTDGKRWKTVSTSNNQRNQLAKAMAGINEPAGRNYDSINIANQILRNKQNQTINNQPESRQPSEIQCRLSSVYFVDERNGWIAGGYDLPFVDRSRGVILRTRNGGQTWQAISGLLIPAISKIEFTSPSNGWAVGDSSSLYPTGAFSTNDGGATWTAISHLSNSASPSLPKLDWVDAIKTPSGHLAISRSGNPVAVRPMEIKPARFEQQTTGRINKLKMLDAKRGIAVGNRGTLMKTLNGGSSWSEINIGADLSTFDFAAIGETASKIWIGGSPGSTLISLDKATLAASAHSTQVQTPISDLHFVDEQHGWAVGALGVIVATDDGGQSWNLQRGNFRSVAFMGVAENEQSVPFVLYSQLANEQDLVGVSVVLDTEKDQAATKQAVTRQAVSVHAAGESGSNQQQLQRLVRDIRTFRPSLIVVGGDVRTQLLVSEAITRAADSNSFPEQLNIGGLRSFQAKRLAVPDSNGAVKFDPRKMLPRLGQTLGDSMGISRALVGLPVTTSDSFQFRVEDLTAGRSEQSHLTNGLRTGSDLLQRTSTGSRGNLEIVRQASNRQKAFDYLLNMQVDSPAKLTNWKRLVQQTTLGVQPEVAGVWLMKLAEAYVENGNWQLAGSALESLITYFPKHPLSLSATSWLIEMYASQELAHVEFQKFQRMMGQDDDSPVQTADLESVPTKFQIEGGPVLQLWVPKSVLKQAQASVQQAGHISDTITESMTPEGFANLRLQHASQLLMRLRQRDPDVAAAKRFKFTEARITGLRDNLAVAENQFRQLIRNTDPELVLAARREVSLSPNSNDKIRLKSWPIVRAPHRPHLDGKLDDAVWQIQTKDKLEFATRNHECQVASDQPDRVSLAYDDDFIYVAARFQKIKGQIYTARPRPTERDPDIGRSDRLLIQFDTDRDYETAYKFEVDFRGWVRESCAGGTGWNPDCFVNQQMDKQSWTVEMAIPRSELTWQEFKAGNAWAVKVQRMAYGQRDVWTDSAPVPFSPQSLDYAAGQFRLLKFAR